MMQSGKEWAAHYFDGRLNFTFEELVDMAEAVQRDALKSVAEDRDGECRTFAVEALEELRKRVDLIDVDYGVQYLSLDIENCTWPPKETP